MKRSWRSCRNVRQRTTALWSTLLQRSEPWRRVLVHCLHQFHIKTTTATKMLYWKWNTEVERTREQKRDIQPNLARLSGGDGTTDIQSRMSLHGERKNQADVSATTLSSKVSEASRSVYSRCCFDLLEVEVVSVMSALLPNLLLCMCKVTLHYSSINHSVQSTITIIVSGFSHQSTAKMSR